MFPVNKSTQTKVGLVPAFDGMAVKVTGFPSQTSVAANGAKVTEGATTGVTSKTKAVEGLSFTKHKSSKIRADTDKF